MYKFALLFVAATTVVNAGSLPTKTRLASPAVDGEDEAGGARSAGPVAVPLIFSLTGLTLSLIMIAECNCDPSALAVY
jgi:hypothetical protein